MKRVAISQVSTPKDIISSPNERRGSKGIASHR
jgi:hypothetical protein